MPVKVANSSLDLRSARGHKPIVCSAKVLVVALACGIVAGGCSDAGKKARKSQAKTRSLDHKPGDAVIDGCLAQYPRTGHLGGGIDEQRVWKICMVQSGQESGLCDTSKMLGMATAVCIARAKGLPMAANWRARIEFVPAPVPQVFWRFGLTDESAQTWVDVHTGESQSRGLDAGANSVLLDAQKSAKPAAKNAQ